MCEVDCPCWFRGLILGEIIKIGEGKFEQIWRARCPHRHLLIDRNNETIECKDCKAPMSPFKAFTILIQEWEGAQADLKCRREELEELEQRREKGLLKATQNVDRAWRSRGMVPVCPHCRQAIFPDDGFGNSRMNRTMAIEARKFKKDRG